MLTIKEFESQFKALTSEFSWLIQGFIDQDNIVYPIDSDTKVLSTVFERLSSPVIRSIAKQYGYIVEVANQTTYPDFTLTIKHGNVVVHRVAIDIKTTYIARNKAQTAYKKTKLTLGSYKSFIRNNTKNILHPYDSYTDHWVLGFVYSRADGFNEYDLESMPQRGDIKCPYNVESIFIREKVELTGIRAGSGNTANIGSIEILTPDGFETAKGPFTSFANRKQACDYYWSNYERLKAEVFSEADLTQHEELQQFLCP